MTLAAIVGTGMLFASGESGSLASQAEAWIGRPLTPMSYAGVARRTTRRAYAAGAVGVYGAPVYGAPIVYGAPAYAPACYQVAGPYGGIVTRCP
jgi:hypothetical protein